MFKLFLLDAFKARKFGKLNEKCSYIFKIQCKKGIKSTICIFQVKRWTSFMRLCVHATAEKKVWLFIRIENIHPKRNIQVYPQRLDNRFYTDLLCFHVCPISFSVSLPPSHSYSFISAFSVYSWLLFFC